MITCSRAGGHEYQGGFVQSVPAGSLRTEGHINSTVDKIPFVIP